MKLNAKHFSALLLSLGLSVNAQASLFDFSCISSGADDCTIGEMQLAMDVTALGTDQVNFHFTNTGSAASSITAIYFDLGASPSLVLPIFSLAGSSGVAFSLGATPPNLPGGNDPAYNFTADVATDSNSPHLQQNGINPGEWLDIAFNLASGSTFDDLITELTTPFTANPLSSTLRIGLHVQAFPDGGSRSFINTPDPIDPTPVPEPTTLALMGIGLAGLGATRRFKARKA